MVLDYSSGGRRYEKDADAENQNNGNIEGTEDSGRKRNSR